MKKSATFRQQRQSRRARRHALKRRLCEHETAHEAVQASDAPIFRLTVTPPPKRYHEPISGRPALNRRHSKDNRE